MNTAEDLATTYGHNSGDAAKPSPSIKFEVKEITPEMAAEMIATTDRDIETKDQRKAVDTYAQAMANEAWILNGLPIIFDEEGKLLDGILRLTACVKAGVPFKTVVARNVRADTLHTIDQHRRRLYQGVLEARGIQHAGTIVRLMGKMIRIENGDFGLAEIPISWSRYDRVLEANPELHTACNIALSTRGNALHSTARPALAFMAIRAGKQNELNSFLRELGPNPTQGFESPPRMLAMQFSLMKDNDKGYDTDKSLALAILAFNDYIAGKKATSHYTWDKDFGGPASTRKLRKKDDAGSVPVNLGLPMVTGYPGLRDGGFDTSATTDIFGGQTDEDLIAGVRADDGKEAIRMVNVTPAMAREWLQFNTGNRKIQRSHIQAIKRDILAGNWMMNAQPICFTADPAKPKGDEPPRLLNGQHRLFAIIEADVPVEIPVAYGIPEAAFATYDVHAKRSPTSNGQSRVDARVVGAAARLQWKEDNGYQLVGGKDGSPTTSELIEIINRHPGLEEAFPLSRRKGLVDIATSGVLTYFIYRIMRDNPVTAETFLKGLETGAELRAGNPILGLRKSLMEDRDVSGRGEILGKLLEGWDDFKEWTVRMDKKAGKATKKSDEASDEQAEEREDAEGAEQPQLL